jgi:hypothetical protein
MVSTSQLLTFMLHKNRAVLLQSEQQIIFGLNHLARLMMPLVSLQVKAGKKLGLAEAKCEAANRSAENRASANAVLFTTHQTIR